MKRFQRHLLLIALITSFASGLSAQTTDCVVGYATNVVGFTPGTNQIPSPTSNILGNTPGTFLNLGRQGNVILEFASDFSTSGDSLPDLCITESGFLDCYYICLSPADAFTTAALLSLGFPNNSTEFFEMSQIHCGTTNIDLDAFFPGFNLGDLRFDRLMILDADGPPNGAEIALVCANYVCDDGPITPQVCPPEFAQSIEDLFLGANQNGSSPMNALNDDMSSAFQLGSGGFVVLAFANLLSNNGTSAPELQIDEVGLQDCYRIRLAPADTPTASALTGAGLVATEGFFDLGQIFCGDAAIDFDAALPGNALGSLRFLSVMIVDDNAGIAGGAEIATVISLFPSCSELPVIPDPPTPATCVPGTIATVGITTPGSTPESGMISNLLDPTPGTCYSPGVLGSVAVRFDGPITSSGTTAMDFRVDVTNPVPYSIGLLPANTATSDALIAAGLTMAGEFFVFPGGPFIQDRSFDVDAAVPGFISGQLSFSDMLLMDAGMNPATSTCFTSVLAEFVCMTSTPNPDNISWANEVVDYDPTDVPPGSDPQASLGAPDGVFVPLGSGGCLEDRRNCELFTNSGDATRDIVIIESDGDGSDENADVDDYRVAIRPWNETTALAITSMGAMDANSDGYFELGVFTGSTEIDIDAYFPGAPAGILVFDAIQICDIPGALLGGDDGGAEIDAIGFANIQPEVNNVSPEGISNTFFSGYGFPTDAGTGPTVNSNGNNIEGAPDGIPLALGENGAARAGYLDSFFTSDGCPDNDLFIFEVGDDEGYRIELCPADAFTTAALAALYMDADGDGCYEIPTVFTGNAEIDIDDLVPGYNACELLFEFVEITDDGMAPDTSSTGNAGADIDAVAFIHKKRPGTDDPDCLRLSYQQGFAGFETDPSVFFVSGGEEFSIKFEAPDQTCGNQITCLAVQCGFIGQQIDSPIGFPGIWVNPNRVAVTIPFCAPNIPAEGICLPITTPVGFAGTCCIFQLISPSNTAPNGIYYSSNALEVCVVE